LPASKNLGTNYIFKIIIMMPTLQISHSLQQIMLDELALDGKNHGSALPDLYGRTFQPEPNIWEVFS
jgi:hypothetical protein